MNRESFEKAIKLLLRNGKTHKSVKSHQRFPSIRVM